MVTESIAVRKQPWERAFFCLAGAIAIVENETGSKSILIVPWRVPRVPDHMGTGGREIKRTMSNTKTCQTKNIRQIGLKRRSFVEIYMR
jgi:hypothetical protein